ncbi:hypothetical protein ACFPTY_19985 [Halomonas beimenensis]
MAPAVQVGFHIQVAKRLAKALEKVWATAWSVARLPAATTSQPSGRV